MDRVLVLFVGGEREGRFESDPGGKELLALRGFVARDALGCDVFPAVKGSPTRYVPAGVAGVQVPGPPPKVPIAGPLTVTGKLQVELPTVIGTVFKPVVDGVPEPERVTVWGPVVRNAPLAANVIP